MGVTAFCFQDDTMYSTLPTPPNSHDLPALHGEAQRPSDDFLNNFINTTARRKEDQERQSIKLYFGVVQ